MHYSLNNILIELIFVFSHFLLLVINLKVARRKVMHPAVLFSFLWFAVLLLHFIFSFTVLDELPPLTISTYFIFFIGAVAFSFGSFIQTLIWQKYFSTNTGSLVSEAYDTSISYILRLILLAIIIIGLPFFLIASYKIFIASNLESFFIGLRSELIYGEKDIGILKYLFPVSFVAYAINLYSYLKEKNQNNKILFIVSFLATIIYAIFSTGRLLFLLVLVVYVGMRFLHDKNFSLKKLSRLLVIFFTIFILFGIVYGKGGNVESSAKENIIPAAQSTAVYMVASLNALDWDMHHQYKINYNGNNSLRFFIKIGERLNLISNAKINELLTPFVFVPYLTNVYTFYSPYIKDFGRLYSWLMIAFFGFIHAFFYNKATTTGNLRHSLYYSIMLFPLLISFFADQYLTLTSFWLQITFLIESTLFLNAFFISKK